MGTRLTIDQLEKLKTHELADMLANVVLLLRRMPDVECKQLIQQVPGNQHVAQPPLERVSAPASSYTREELEKKKVTELKILAKELNVFVPASVKKKDDLIARILARSANGRSEQRAMLAACRRERSKGLASCSASAHVIHGTSRGRERNTITGRTPSVMMR